jgi:hypothetical protein
MEPFTIYLFLEVRPPGHRPEEFQSKVWEAVSASIIRVDVIFTKTIYGED